MLALGAPKRRSVGRFVRLEFARTFVAAFGKVPIFERAAESRREHHRAEISCYRRYTEGQLDVGVALALVLIINHQMPARRYRATDHVDNLRFQAEAAYIDRRIVGKAD